MGTRLEKSRPTKRPIARHDGSSYVSPSNRYPKTDKKGYPQSDGIPIPVLVDGPAPGTGPVNPGPEAPNDDLVFADTLIVVPSSTGDPTDLLLLFPALEIGNNGDTNNPSQSVPDGGRIYIATETGTNLLVTSGPSIPDESFAVYACASQDFTGILQDGQQVDVWVEPPGAIAEEFDPSQNTIPQVQTYIVGLGDPNDPAVISETQRVLDEERAGLNRSSLVSWLDARPGVV